MRINHDYELPPEMLKIIGNQPRMPKEKKAKLQRSRAYTLNTNTYGIAVAQFLMSGVEEMEFLPAPVDPEKGITNVTGRGEEITSLFIYDRLRWVIKNLKLEHVVRCVRRDERTYLRREDMT